MPGQTGPKGFTEDEIAEALEKSAGIALVAAKLLKCSRQNVEMRIKNSERLLKVQAECNEDVLDLAESVLLGQLKRKSLRAAIYILERKGKDRGWVKRIENTGKDGAPLTPERQTVDISEESFARARRFIDNGSE